MSSYAENEEDAREYAELKRLNEEERAIEMNEILDHRARERAALAQTLKFIQSKLEGNEKVIITPKGIDVRIIDTERHDKELMYVAGWDLRSLSYTSVDAINAADMIQGLGHYPGGLPPGTNEQDSK